MKDHKRKKIEVGASARYAGFSGGANFSYEGEMDAEYQHNLVDPSFSGYYTLGANSRMDFDDLDMTKTWYLTVIILFNDGTCRVEA